MANANANSPELRRALLAKMLGTGALYDSVTSPAEVSALLRLFLEWLLQEDSEQSHLVSHGRDQFIRLARLRPAEFRDHFVNPNLVIDIFNNSMYSNKVST